MKLVSKQCPHCGNPELKFAHRQNHCECELCGSKYAIDWSNPSDLHLNNFSLIAQRVITNTQFLAADKRLVYIKTDIRQAEAEVEVRQSELDRGVAGFEEQKNVCNKRIWVAKAWFWGIVIAAAVTWYLVLFVLENAEWYLFILIGIGEVAWGVTLHQKWKRVEQRVRRILKRAKLKVDELSDSLSEAQLHLKDLNLEREKCRIMVGKYRYTDTDVDHAGLTPISAE